MDEYRITHRDLQNLDVDTDDDEDAGNLCHSVIIGGIKFWSYDLELLQTYFETIGSAFKQIPE